jgi:hypothetical protein
VEAVVELLRCHGQIKLVLRLAATDLVKLSGEFSNMAVQDRTILEVIEVNLVTRSVGWIGRLIQ